MQIRAIYFAGLLTGRLLNIVSLVIYSSDFSTENNNKSAATAAGNGTSDSSRPSPSDVLSGTADPNHRNPFHSIWCCLSRKSRRKMEDNTFLTEDPAFQNLERHFKDHGSKININQLFKDDPDRFHQFR